MAVAIGSTDLKPYGDYATTSFISQHFSYTNTGTGNALLIQTIADYYYTVGTDPWNGAATVTYGGQTMTQDWSLVSGNYWAKTVKGFHLLNAPSGPNDVVITFAVNADYLNVAVCSVTGASTTSISSTSKSEIVGAPNGVFGSSTLTVPSASGNLVVAAAFAQTDLSGQPVSYTNGSWITSPTDLTPYMAQYSGASSVAVTMGGTSNAGDSFFEFIIGAWSIPPSAVVTPHAYVGYSGVANQIQTTPGNASGVVGSANIGLGDDVAGSGVVDVYTGVS